MQFDRGKEGERGRMEALDYSAKIKKDVGKGTLDENYLICLLGCMGIFDF